MILSIKKSRKLFQIMLGPKSAIPLQGAYVQHEVNLYQRQQNIIYPICGLFRKRFLKASDWFTAIVFF